jgi:soluble cytochrome b562
MLRKNHPHKDSQDAAVLTALKTVQDAVLTALKAVQDAEKKSPPQRPSTKTYSHQLSLQSKVRI